MRSSANARKTVSRNEREGRGDKRCGTVAEARPTKVKTLGTVIVKHEDNTDYDFDDSLFKGSFGRAGIEDADHKIKIYEHPIMAEVPALEEAKRDAMMAMSDLIKNKNAETAAVFQKDVIDAEHDVVSCRIALMNRFFSADSDVMLCNHVHTGKDSQNVKTSVTYRKYRNRAYDTDENETLYPTQSQVGWSASYEWYKLKPLLSPNRGESQRAEIQNTLNMMLDMVMRGMTHDDSTDLLYHVHKYNIAARPLEFTCSTKHNDFLGKDIWKLPESTNKEELIYTADRSHQGTPFRFEVMVGKFDVNHCDQWHNPLINKFVQKAVLATAQVSINNDTLNLAVQITIKITHHNVVHILTLAPYVNPDVCSVLHIYTNDEKGILDLHDRDISSLDGVDMDIAYNETEFYYCLGAHRNIRFTEQELNYIHTEAFLYEDSDHDINALDIGVLPDPRLLGLSGDNPRAKSTRISFDGWDIIVSTYQNHLERDENDENEDEEENPETEIEYKTVISLFNYPPFGTRYRKIKDVENRSNSRGNYNRERAPPMHPLPYGGGGYHHHQQPSQPPPTERERRQNFRAIPHDGGMKYFIWYDTHDPKMKYVITVMDHSHDKTPTQEMIDKGLEVNKKIYQDFSNGDIWLTNPPTLVHNITENNNMGPHGKTVRETYLDGYREYITSIIMALYNTETKAFDQESKYYLRCKAFSVWDTFVEDIERMGIENAQEMIDDWKSYTRERYDNEDEAIKKNIRDTLPTPSPTAPVVASSITNARGGLSTTPQQQTQRGSIIPRPGGGRSYLQATASPPTTHAIEGEVQRMKQHIASLETKIQEDTRRSENRDHLLQEVLSRFDPDHHRGGARGGVMTAPQSIPPSRQTLSNHRP